MADDVRERLAAAAEVVADLQRDDLVAALSKASATVIGCLRGGGTVLVLGNGGSAADAAHLTAEFVGRCTVERRGLPAICLADSSAIVTAVGNDYGFDQIFARQIESLGRPGDVVIALSTSGNSPNVLEALRVARERGLVTIAIGGRDGGAMAALSNIALIAPSAVTARIQECHQVWGHLIAEDVDRVFAGDLE